MNVQEGNSQERDCATTEGRSSVRKAAKDFDDVMCKLAGRGQPLLAFGSDEHAYLINQTGAKHFEIEFNPVFVQIGTSARDHKSYVNACLKKYERFLKGPEGETLSIKAVSKNEIRPTFIEIIPEGARSHSLGYSGDIDCPTILHETLHLLGLQDEYPEKVSGYIMDRESGEHRFVTDSAEVVGYDCRATTVPESIMYDPMTAVLSVLPPNRLKVVTCVCEGPTGKRTCEKLKRLKDPSRLLSSKVCPKGLTSRSITEEGVAPEDLINLLEIPAETINGLPSVASGPAKLNFSPIDDGAEGFSLEPFYDGAGRAKRESLLMPAHFRAIVYPLCTEKNRRYRECTEEAYQNSAVKECSMKVKECQSNLDWLQ